MKQIKEVSLSVQTEKSRKLNTAVYIPACIFSLWGFFGLLFREWKLEDCGGSLLPLMLLALLICIVLLFLQQSQKNYVFILPILIFLPVLFMILFRQLFSGSLGTILNQAGDWLYLKTGCYVNRFAENGNPWPILLLLSVVAGLLTQIMVSQLKGRLLLITVAAYAGLLVSGTISFGLEGILLLTGCLLALLAGTDGNWKAWLSGVTAFAATGLLVLAVGSLLPDSNTAAADWLKELIHRGKYEKTDQAMPEGSLADLGAFTPSDEAALTISMQEWKTTYLRGFQGGNYTGSSWESFTPEEMEEEKNLLCALQNENFYPSTQLAEGWKTLGRESDNSIQITNMGACSAWDYLPYGGVNEGGLSPRYVTGEGSDKGKTGPVQYDLYPVEESYLLMQELSSEEHAVGSAAYLERESQYRDFVKDHYLDIPDQIQFLLEQHELRGTTGISTTQACHEIRILLKKTLQYNEAAIYYNDSTDFLEYMLNSNPYGYSVHYATLAVMMLRSYGIPARYVEGYYIPASQTAGLEAGENFTVTQKNSSAWVEYYTEGVGWLVFDPTPGHTDTINYQMPVGDGDADMKTGNMGLASENNKNKDKQEDEEEEDDRESTETSQKKTPVVRILLTLLLIMILLLFVALVLRTILLRRKMKLQRACFEDPDPRIGTAAILCVERGLVCQSLHIPESAFFENPEGMVTELLDLSEEDFRNWKQIADEVQFSPHAISEDTRQAAREWLMTTEQSWHDGVSLPRRLLQKYIFCKVY